MDNQSARTRRDRGAMPSHRASAAFAYVDLHPAAGDFRAEVLAGLAQPQKALPPKYLYDRRGAQLFEAICETPEYYPTRTEQIGRAHV